MTRQIDMSVLTVSKLTFNWAPLFISLLEPLSTLYVVGNSESLAWRKSDRAGLISGTAPDADAPVTDFFSYSDSFESVSGAKLWIAYPGCDF